MTATERFLPIANTVILGAILAILARSRAADPPALRPWIEAQAAAPEARSARPMPDSPPPAPRADPAKHWWTLTGMPGWEAYGGLDAQGRLVCEKYRRSDQPEIVLLPAPGMGYDQFRARMETRR